MSHATSISRCIPLALLLAMAGATGLHAQDHPNVAKGFGVETSFQAGAVDNVNVLNGNLAITLPIGQRYPLPGGLSYGLTLIGNTKLWEQEEVFQDPNPTLIRIKPSPDFNAGLGWTLDLGRLLPPSHPDNNTFLHLYRGPDGAEHTFHPTLHPADPVTANVHYTRDGSYLRLKIGTFFSTVEFPDGTIHSFDNTTRLTQIRNLFGSWMSVSHTGSTWTLRDSLGRSHTITFEPAAFYGANGRVKSVQLVGFAGKSALYTFHYEEPTINVGCPHNVDNNPWVTVPILTKVALPEGGFYAMPTASGSYNLPSGAQCDPKSGLLRKVTLPTLGRLEWDYAVYKLPVDSGDVADGCKGLFGNSAGVSARRTIQKNGQLEGAWSYSQALEFQCAGFATEPPQESVTTVIDALGHKSEHFFSVSYSDSNGFMREHYGLPISPREKLGGHWLSRREYQGSGTNRKRTVFTHYEWDSDGAIQGGGNQRLVAERTRYEDDGSRIRDVTYSDFDGLGHYRTATVKGIGPIRVSTTKYNPAYGSYAHQGPGPGYKPWETTSPWVLGTFSEQTASEAGVTARESFCFLPNGQLERRRTHRLQSPDSRDLLQEFEYNGQGELINERSHGGDLQVLSTSAQLCSLALPAPAYELQHTYQSGSLATSKYLGVTHFNTQRIIDPSTGLPARSIDNSGLTTTFKYDLLGRTTRVTVPGEVVTTVDYTAAVGANSAAAIVRRGGGLTQTTYFFDGFGRVITEDRRTPHPSGTGTITARRKSEYNAAGLRSRVSEVNVAGSGNSWTEFKDYDPFGRPRKIVAPDGSLTTLTYFGIRRIDRQVKIGTGHTAGGVLLQSPSTTREIYDVHGRLTRVKELAGPNASSAWTDYKYDVGNRLSEVIQEGQRRRFTYDLRGFLLSETHPELGIFGNGRITYSRYDALGNAGRRSDGRSDLGFAYDPAQRLLTVNEASGLRRSLKRYTYAGQDLGIDRRKGKLIETVRTNWVLNPSFPQLGEIPVEVIERYQYKNSSGRISSRTTLTNNVANMPEFTVGYTYNNLGLLSTLSYPRCGGVGSNCTTLTGGYKSIVHTYDRGQLSTIPGYLTGLTYHPNGMIHEVKHSNGITDTHDEDPWHMRRPRRITNQIFNEQLAGGIPEGSQAQQNGLGPYEFDGSGNITTVGCGVNFYCRRYHYDRVHRLVEDTDESNGWQSYTYDRFGNRTASTTKDGAAPATTTIFPTSKTANHLTSVAYDASGNQLSWGQFNYEWDPFNNLKTLKGGGNHRTYLYTADDERFWQSEFTNAEANDLWTFTLRGLDNKVLTLYESQANTGPTSWTLIKDYIYRNGQLLAAENYTEGSTHHFSLDHLGTPRVLTNAAGIFVSTHTYFGFGEEILGAISGGDNEKMVFTGHERDFNSNAGSSDDLDYMHARYFNPNTGRFLSVDPVRSSNRLQPQTWNKYIYALSNPMRFIDPNGATVASALEQITENAIAIQFSSDATGGRVTPLDIVRVVFQENRNDFNLIKNNDKSALVGAGGPEIKNSIARLQAALGSTQRSFGIAEMQVGTAARLLGWDPNKLTAKQRNRVRKMLSNPVASLILAALYLDELKRQRPGAPIEVILSDYNRGVTDLNTVTEVGARSGSKLSEITAALGKGLNEGGSIRVVRCSGEYKFEHQCSE